MGARPSRSALLRVYTDRGQPVPEGARARLKGASEWFPVGKDGLVYVEGLDRFRHLQITWNGTLCEIPGSLPATPEGGGLADLGTFQCEMSHR